LIALGAAMDTSLYYVRRTPFRFSQETHILKGCGMSTEDQNQRVIRLPPTGTPPLCLTLEGEAEVFTQHWIGESDHNIASMLSADQGDVRAVLMGRGRYPQAERMAQHRLIEPAA
jgi:hypothetical protein